LRARIYIAIPLLVLFLSCVSLGQTLKNLAHQPPDGAFLTFQLTDGTVLTQGNNESDWYKLTPDINGSYLNGTWTRVADLPSGYVPDAFASQVLADGRVLIEGGEYLNNAFTLTNLGAVYDPVKNTWTPLPPPPTWGFIGDSPSAVLPNGQFLIGNKLVKNIALLDPKTMKWIQGVASGKADFNAEEGWTLMPDGSILTADVKAAPNSERFIPSQRKWISAGSTIVDLHSPSGFGCLPFGPNGQYCYYPPGEIGPAILRPDGTVFATGSTPQNENHGHTAIYHPSADPQGAGSWSVGPDFPTGDDAGDSFASLLPNGRVLVAGNSGTLSEFDGTNMTRTVNGYGGLMVLPTGETMVSDGSVQLYTTTGTYQDSWRPTISNFPASVTRGSSYQISGTQFNGLSQAASFGDEYETSTNYPLVRITNKSSHHVFYARTHDHSSMGVATGTAPVSTNFDVPAAAETGASTLEVVANGIPSVAVSITVN
jgi:hypothetical protein